MKLEKLDEQIAKHETQLKELRKRRREQARREKRDAERRERERRQHDALTLYDALIARDGRVILDGRTFATNDAITYLRDATVGTDATHDIIRRASRPVRAVGATSAPSRDGAASAR